MLQRGSNLVREIIERGWNVFLCIAPYLFDFDCLCWSFTAQSTTRPYRAGQLLVIAA